jgi:preprotein translocase subunit SecD
VVDTPNGYKRQLLKPDEVYFLDPKPIMTAKNIKASEIHENWLNNKQYFWLTMRLDKEGTENWSYATRVAIAKRLAFIIDNRLLQVVTVKSQMTDGIAVLARADFSKQEVENFKTILENEK